MLSGEHYFDGRVFVFKLLRLFNLMEPDRTVLSISKLVMWTAWAAMAAILWSQPDNWVALLGATGGAGAATGNYAYRRKCQTEGDEP